MSLLQIIRNELVKIIDNIDTGNSNLSNEEMVDVLSILKKYTDKDIYLSKYQACDYLHISRATFDNLVKEGKLPKGIKQQGFKELSWLKKDLDSFLSHKIEKNKINN